MTSSIRRRPWRRALLATVCAAVLGVPVSAAAAPAPVLVVSSGQTYVATTTLRLSKLVIEPGGMIATPDGDSVTLTVNGVDTGERLTATGATDTAIKAGTYRGDVVLTVSARNDVAFGGLTFPFRQALYLDASGVVRSKSVLAALRHAPSGSILIGSTGEAFNGVYVAGGSNTLTSPQIRLTGNGRSDFAGYGSAIVATGTGTRLVLNHAVIDNHGAVRTAVVADGGSNVIVKNSQLSVSNGVLPADYVPTVDTTYMESVPWMLSLSGNNRATNLLGVDTKASYINSSISSEGWGVLSTDSGMNGQLTAIDSRVTNTGLDGYGSYAIGNATERFLGNTFDVATYATINRGGAVYYGDSSKTAVAALNRSLGLGLTAAELDALPVRPSIVNSRRFGFMWHGGGTLGISGGTVVNTREATFLDKGQYVGITVDGSQGARLNPANGILMQMMDDDDPGPNMVNGHLVNNGVYTQPTTPPDKVTDFDVTTAHADDALTTFAHTTLRGNFYNGIRGNAPAGPFGPGLQGKNLVLTLDGSSLTGVVSATTATHHVSTITADNYRQLGEVTNAAGPVINNGVLVTLTGHSHWNVTGTSFLSKLTLSADSVVTGSGHAAHMTVDGVPTAIAPGHIYTGAIVITNG